MQRALILGFGGVGTIILLTVCDGRRSSGLSARCDAIVFMFGSFMDLIDEKNNMQKFATSIC